MMVPLSPTSQPLFSQNLVKSQSLIYEPVGVALYRDTDSLPADMSITQNELKSYCQALVVSERTKEGLKAARAKGKLLGRPKGPGKSKLDKHRDEIVDKLKLGVPKTKIARRY
jgi:hypothetical protein